MLSLKRWFLIFLIVSILLIIAGIIFIIIGAKGYESTREEIRYSKSDHVGAVIDAGGSGTRLIVYSYKPDTNSIKQRFFTLCEDKGLDKYEESEMSKVETLLQNCLNRALNNNNLPKDKTVPLYFGATGGMRILRQRDIVHHRNLFMSVQKVLKNSKFNISMSDTISGNDEATWGWIAGNLPGSKDPKIKDQSGVLDFGSTSIQIAFAPGENVQGVSGLQKIKLNGKEITVYGNSYLCFGRDQMDNRFMAKLVKEGGYKNITDNPCFFDGYEKHISSSDLFSAPCTSGNYAKSKLGESIDPPNDQKIFTIRGTSNRTECANAFSNLISLSCTEGKTSCGLNDVYQPPVKGLFLALSTFYFTAAYLELPISGASLSEFKAKTDELCAKKWDDVKDVGEAKFAPNHCFDASYAYFVLKEGFKFADDTNQLHYIGKKGSEKVQWSLGLIYTKRADLPKINGLRTRLTIIERSPNMIGLIIIGVIFIIFGIILLVFTIRAKRNKKLELVSTIDEEEA